MSLQPRPGLQIPEETARVARAAFARPTLPMRIADSLGAVFDDEEFAALFAAVGRPALSPARLALVTLLQFTEDLADRAAADAVRSRIDWKYLLGLELTDPGFDFSVLCEFRARLLAAGAERMLFERILAHCREQKWLKARGRQRTDSTHVLGAIRSLNRLEFVVETIHAALNALATVAPEFVRAWARPEWVERYGRRGDDYRLPKARAERDAYFEVVGEDGYALLAAVGDTAAPGWLREVPALVALRRVWIEQYQEVEGKARGRGPQDQPPSSQLTTSPHDTQARYASKRGTHWVGYKVHITETCDEERPHLITHVETDRAGAADLEALPRIHEALEGEGLVPDKHLVDSGYVDAGELAESQERYGVELLGPARTDTTWQARQEDAYGMGSFSVNWEAQQVRCPQGRTSMAWQQVADGRGGELIKITFAQRDCGPCASRAQCTRRPRRMLSIRPRREYEALAAARERERRDGFKQEYGKRAGVEGTISQAVRAFGVRRSRYIGMAKTRMQHLLTAAAINLVRIDDWLGEVTRAQTRRSAFARVMAGVAA